MKKSALSIATLFVLLSVSILFPQMVDAQTASNQIVIRQNGSVDGTSLIQRSGDLYMFTADVEGSIVIEKSNIIVDGVGFALQASDDAFTIEGQSNVTIRNLSVGSYSGTGMLLNQVSACNVLNVTLQAERAGIRVRNVTNCTFTGNHIEARVEYGLSLSSSTSNIVANNTIVTQMIDAVNCGYSTDNVIVGNTLTYKDSEYQLAFGIEFDGSTNCTISMNTITGFPMTGINLQGDSENNCLEANNIVSCSSGIHISSSNNSLTDNVVAHCNNSGIAVSTASGNVLKGNRLTNNTQNFAVTSYSAEGWINDVDTSNTVNGKPVIFLVNQVDKAVPSEAGFIELVNCTGMTIEGFTYVDAGECILLAYTNNCTIANNTLLGNSNVHLYSSSANNITHNTFTGANQGLRLEYYCFNNIISGNIFADNNHGVFFSSSSSNTVTANNFTDNQNALYFNSASDNTIFLNNFQNNTRDVGDYGLDNTYASVVPAAAPSTFSSGVSVQMFAHVSVEPVNFVGPPPLSVNVWDNGSHGNYWSSYNGTDADGNGVADAPYYLYGNNQDNYPLMQAATTVIPEFPSLTLLLIAFFVSAVVVVACRVKTESQHARRIRID
ncbi:MAG: right-handed parallel beta-helix repeat-containing protein [Candidatus Bathyarchaeota archaeon]|nr:right-handed parallel beta-helix repeat-containing protein [Candidatus Bathyarchaeota archaeon]